MTHQSYPLEWPEGRPRLSIGRRRVSRFRDLSFAKCRSDLLQALKTFGATDVVLSTSIPTRRDGLPYAGMRAPDDPGVAVYFTLRGDSYLNAAGQWARDDKKFAIACDTYRRVSENARALVHTIRAMHTINRHGSSELLAQAMSGFAALPPSPPPESWWSVLGFTSKATLMQARVAYRDLVSRHHPDRGGSHEMMVRLNGAIARAEIELAPCS